MPNTSSIKVLVVVLSSRIESVGILLIPLYHRYDSDTDPGISQRSTPIDADSLLLTLGKAVWRLAIIFKLSYSIEILRLADHHLQYYLKSFPSSLRSLYFSSS